MTVWFVDYYLHPNVLLFSPIYVFVNLPEQFSLAFMVKRYEKNHSNLFSENAQHANNVTNPSICIIHIFISVYFCSVLEGLYAIECHCCVFIQGGSVWDMEQQVLQMWLWRRRIPQWVSLHQDRFFDGARRGLHARYRSAESTAFVKSVSCWNWISSELTLESFWPRLSIWKPFWRNGNESSLLSQTQMITIDYELNSTVTFMVLLSMCEYDREREHAWVH